MFAALSSFIFSSLESSSAINSDSFDSVDLLTSELSFELILAYLSLPLEPPLLPDFKELSDLFI